MALAASAWWTLHTYRGSQERAAADRMQVVSGLLANSAETFLAGGTKPDLSNLRRTVAEAALNYHLDRCRIILPDGQTVADANPKTPVVRELPKEWPAMVTAQPTLTYDQERGRLGSSLNFRIPSEQMTGRMRLRVEVEVPGTSHRAESEVEVAAGAAVPGAGVGCATGG